MFERTGLWNELIAALEEQVKLDPNDIALQMRLGSAQIKAGKADQGKATLLAALKNADTPEEMNEGSFALADINQELLLDEEYARKADKLLSARTLDWSANTQTLQQGKDQKALLATWDTLGWILYKENRSEEAESYIQAAWLNSPRADIGFHMGLVEERAGHDAAALAIYDMSISLLKPAQIKLSAIQPDPVVEGLHKRIASLKLKGVTLQSRDAHTNLQKLRTLPDGNTNGGNLLITYSIILNGGKLTDLLPTAHSLGDANDSTDEMIHKVDFSKWTPAHSDGKLLRTGVLNCHSGICEFVINPL